MKQLKLFDSLNLREKKQYASIPENWKLKPLCCLSNVSDEEVYYATSEEGTVSSLDVFRKVHTFTLYLLNKTGEQVLCFKKHAGIFSNKMEIFNADEDHLGSVQKHGASKTHFQVLDAGGQVFYEIDAPALNPETFHIRKGDTAVGRISKRPTRIAEEGVSRNDHFGIVFPFAADTTEKGVLLGALFLIDLTF
ncbi:MAG: phospholipid scramblase-related protein [Candidatus Omnitrophota bacterium]